MSSTSDTAVARTLDAQTARLIGVEVYLYLYPLVTMDITRRQLTNIQAGEMPGARADEHGQSHPGVPGGGLSGRGASQLRHAAPQPGWT